MAELLSPVREDRREECVKHGHELDDDKDEQQQEYEKGWFATGMSVIWWSTGPVRYSADKVANVYPPLGKYLTETADTVTEVIQSNFPYMTDEESEKTMVQLRDMVCRSARHKMRSAIRSKPGRTLLLGLDKVVSMSESVLDCIENSKCEEKEEEPSKKKSTYYPKEMEEAMKHFQGKKPEEYANQAENYEEAKKRFGAKFAESAGKFDEMMKGEDYDDVDEEKKKRDASAKSGETKKGGEDSAEGKDWKDEYDRWMSLKLRFQSDKVDKKKVEKKLGLIRSLLAKPLRLWISGLKYVRRYLYRMGRLRRCKTASRTPAKEIARRPKVSPRKRQPPSSFSSLVKQALSPASKQTTVSADQLKDIKTKDLGIPLKRKHSHVSPYSCGDDSDSDTGRIIDDYFMLQDYDSNEDSDYVWYSSDDIPTSDSEEFRTDTDDDELMDEAGQLASDALKDMENVEGDGKRRMKKSGTPHSTKKPGDVTDPTKYGSFPTDPAKSMGYTDPTKPTDFSSDPMKSMGFKEPEKPDDPMKKLDPKKSPARPDTTSMTPSDLLSPKSAEKGADSSKGKKKKSGGKTPQDENKDPVDSLLTSF